MYFLCTAFASVHSLLFIQQSYSWQCQRNNTMHLQATVIFALVLILGKSPLLVTWCTCSLLCCDMHMSSTCSDFTAVQYTRGLARDRLSVSGRSDLPGDGHGMCRVATQPIHPQLSRPSWRHFARGTTINAACFPSAMLPKVLNNTPEVRVRPRNTRGFEHQRPPRNSAC